MLDRLEVLKELYDITQEELDLVEKLTAHYFASMDDYYISLEVFIKRLWLFDLYGNTLYGKIVNMLAKFDDRLSNDEKCKIMSEAFGSDAFRIGIVLLSKKNYLIFEVHDFPIERGNNA